MGTRAPVLLVKDVYGLELSKAPSSTRTLSFAGNVDDYSWICTEAMEISEEGGDQHVGAILRL